MILSHDDYSDLYPDIFDNPVKHMGDLVDAVKAGRKDIFDRLLPKISDHPEAACEAYLKHGLEWSRSVARNHPNDNYISYIELLLGDLNKSGNTKTNIPNAQEDLIEEAFEVWTITPSAMEADSHFFKLYDQFSTVQQKIVQTFALENFSVLQLIKAGMHCSDFELVRAAMRQSHEILFPRQIIERLVVTTPELLDEIWETLPRTREQSFHLIHNLQNHDTERLAAMRRLIALHGPELKNKWGDDFNHHLASEIDYHNNDMAKVLSVFYNPNHDHGLCLLIAAGSSNHPNPEMFDLLFEATTLEQAQHIFNQLSETQQHRCTLLSERLSNEQLHITLTDTLLKQRLGTCGVRTRKI